MATLPNPRRERFAQLEAMATEPGVIAKELKIALSTRLTWLHNPAVVKRINEIKAAAARKTVMDLAEMEERLSQIARADLTEFVKVEKDGSLTITLDGPNTAALEGLDITDWQGGKGGRAQTRARKLKIRDPIAAMDLLAKLQKFYEIPPNFNDNRQYNILVADELTKDEIRRLMAGERRQEMVSDGNDH